jgi:GT2 family glycosyltransferase
VTPSTGSAELDGTAPLLAPAAVRVVDVTAPPEELDVARTPSYRSLMVLARAAGQPIGIATFSLDSGSTVPHDRVMRGLRRRFGEGLEPRRTQADELGNGGRSAQTVSVVVATSGNESTLERCLRSILACRWARIEVLVVDNRPETAQTHRLLETGFAGDTRVRYVEEPRHGASYARNAGLARASGAILAFADDDVVVDPDWIAASVGALMRDPEAACCTGLILPAELESESQLLLEQFASFGKGFRPRRFELPDSREDDPLLPYTVGSIGSGASLVMRADVARALGGFDVALGPGTLTTGGEDLDLLVRVLRAGHAVTYEPGAIVWHQHPSGMRRLRRQAYRYGIGLGAMLTKQLVAGPERRDFVRAVPAGIRYLRAPSSRKNAALPEAFPRQLVWLERLGLVIGPATYAASVVVRDG